MHVTRVVCTLLLLPACKDEASSTTAGSPAVEGKGGEGEDALGAFTEYKRKSMATEAKVNLAAIASGARMYFEQEHVEEGGLQVTTGTLPAPAPMTPPAGTCCKQPDGVCPPDMGEWDHPTWKALMFEPRDAHRYSYEVAVEGETITLRAVGDLDCDGELATFESVGTVADGALEFSPELKETAPLE